MGTPGRSSATAAISRRSRPLCGVHSARGDGDAGTLMAVTQTAPRRLRITWRLARVVETRAETPRARTLVLEVPGWPGHRAGQHVDVRLSAEDGYQTQRSYSIASPPEEAHVSLTVERI